MRVLEPTLMLHAPLVQSYGSDGFRIAGEEFSQSVLVMAGAVYPLVLASLETLNEQDFLPCFVQEPPLEVVLVGTGSTHHRLNPALRAALKARGLSVDSMATGAAARTFNVLLGEDRRVAALLLLPSVS